MVEGVEVFLTFVKMRVSEIKRALGESEKIAHQNLQKALLRSRKMNPDHEKWGLILIFVKEWG